jgi:hypothetical protein
VEEAKPQEEISVGVVGLQKVRDEVRGKCWKARPKKVKDLYPKTEFLRVGSRVAQDTNIRCESGRTICQA